MVRVTLAAATPVVATLAVEAVQTTPTQVAAVAVVQITPMQAAAVEAVRITPTQVAAEATLAEVVVTPVAVAITKPLHFRRIIRRPVAPPLRVC